MQSLIQQLHCRKNITPLSEICQGSDSYRTPLGLALKKESIKEIILKSKIAIFKDLNTGCTCIVSKTKIALQKSEFPTRCLVQKY
jgi:hypothetical protein